MDNMTKFWLLDILSAPVVLVCVLIVIGILSAIWALAMKTFKKFPWNYLWIFVSSLVATLVTVWSKILPKVWLREFKRKKQQRKKEV